jgi:Kef-type K+ transport system membrane component KefB
MNMEPAASNIWQEITILLAAVAFVTAAFRKIGWNPILGLIAVGAVLGGHGFKVINDSSVIEFMSELGIMFLLFVVGLELSIERIRAMARWIFGLGAVHFSLCAAGLAGFVWYFGLPIKAAIVIGLGLSMSSTAFVLQVLSERGELSSRYGRRSFSVLLFQDMMVAPLLAALPLIAGNSTLAQKMGIEVVPILPAVVVMFILFLVARLFLESLLGAIYRSAERDAFPAAILLTALAMAWAAHHLGLSPGLGAFLAGLAISDANWRHEIKAVIEPFETTLLAFFFIGVGMKVPLSADGLTLLSILSGAVGILMVKFALGFLSGLVSGNNWRISMRLAMALAQAGEFSFVVVGLTAAYKLLPQQDADFWTAAAILSMALTPLALALLSKVLPSVRPPVVAAPDEPVEPKEVESAQDAAE